MFIRFSRDSFIPLLVYVDDIVITSNNLGDVEELKEFLDSKFKDRGNLKYLVGLEVD